MASSKFAWAQPVCPRCWVALKHKIGRVDDSKKKEHHYCCFCWQDIPIMIDVYMIRINPGTVPYPTLKKEEEG